MLLDIIRPRHVQQTNSIAPDTLRTVRSMRAKQAQSNDPAAYPTRRAMTSSLKDMTVVSYGVLTAGSQPADSTKGGSHTHCCSLQQGSQDLAVFPRRCSQLGQIFAPFWYEEVVDRGL